LHPVRLDLNLVVNELAPMLRRLIGEDLELVVDPAPGLGLVKADADQFGQVIANLVVNARDAMPKGGKVTIATANVRIDDPAGIPTKTPIPPGEYVQLIVRDTGCGMSDEAKAHLFEPFFTTKAPEQGSGLGLSTAYGIVTQSGGHISVMSALGQGTTILILLPRLPDGNGAAGN
jgi:signal transduction histidine kinase